MALQHCLEDYLRQNVGHVIYSHFPNLYFTWILSLPLFWRSPFLFLSAMNVISTEISFIGQTANYIFFYNDYYNLTLLGTGNLIWIHHRSYFKQTKWEKLINSHSCITWTYHFLHLSKSLLSNFSCFLSLALQIKDTAWLKLKCTFWKE